MKTFISSLVAALLMVACVPQRIMEETKGKLTACETELATVKKTMQENEAKLAELKEAILKCDKDNLNLKTDTMNLGRNYRMINDKFTKLNSINDQLAEFA